MNTITIRQYAAIKRVAQNVNSLHQQRERLQKSIKEMQDKLHDLCAELQLHEAGVMSLTGYCSDDLIQRVKGANGLYKYELRPEMLRYDEEKKVYVIGPFAAIETDIAEDTIEDILPLTPEELMYV